MIKGLIVKTPTRAELVRLFEYADSVGNRWNGGGESLLEKKWIDESVEAYGENLCIMFNKYGLAQYSPHDFYKEEVNGYSKLPIVSVDDVIPKIDVEFDF